MDLSGAYEQLKDKLTTSSKNEIVNYLARSDTHNAMIDTIRDKRAFITLTPRKIEPVRLFMGRTIERYVQEISVYPAIKDENNKMVPDLDNAYFRCILTDKVLSDLMFNFHQYGGEPINITELDGNAIEMASNDLTANEQYNTAFNVKIEKISALANELLKYTTDYLETPKLSKADKRVLSKMVNSLESLINADLSFELGLVKELVQTHSHEAHCSIINTVRSHLTDLASDLDIKSLEFKSKKLVGPLESIFEYHFSQKENAHIFVALKELLDLLNDTNLEDSTTFKKTLKTKISRLAAENRKNIGAEKGKGYVNLSRRSGSTYLFGESELIQQYSSISFGYATDKKNEYGEQEITHLRNILEISLSNIQLMELLQSSFSSIPVKCTIHSVSRTILKVKNEEVDAVKDDDISIKESKLTPNDLPKMLTELDLLLSNSTASKASKERLLELVNLIHNEIQKEIENRTNTFENDKENILKSGREELMRKVEPIIEIAEARGLAVKQLLALGK